MRYARIVGSLSSLKRVQAELMLLSSTDELTGVVNRRTVLVVLEKQFGLAARKGEDISVIFCDLDGLKAVNDGMGHAAGDEYIKVACHALLGALRDSRYRGQARRRRVSRRSCRIATPRGSPSSTRGSRPPLPRPTPA